MSRPPHVCHVFSTFARGGVEVRTAALIGALGPPFRHTIMALDGNYDAADRIGQGATVRLAGAPARKRGIPYPLALGAALRRIGPDLLMTYSWGAIDALIGGQLGRVGPIVHTETGFGPDEAVRRKWRRALARRLLLKRIYATTVPARSLERVALAEFGVPREKLIYIPNGVDLAKFRPRRDPAWRRAQGIPDDAVLFGTVCRLRAEKNLGLLLRAFARADLPDARLTIVGEGPCRAEWRGLARQLDLGERVIFAPELVDPTPCYAALDVFGMSSMTEQMPNALLEAMACGRPAICTDVGDSREMLGNEDHPVIVPRDDEASYAAALTALAGRGELRAALGAANRARCIERYSLDRMVRRYAALYEAAIECAPARLAAVGQA